LHVDVAAKLLWNVHEACRAELQRHQSLPSNRVTASLLESEAWHKT